MGTTVLPLPAVTARKDVLLFAELIQNGFVESGETLLYTITVANDGTVMLPDVVVSDTLPFQVLYLGSSPEVCTWDGSNPLTCDLGDMDPYEYREFQVKVLVAPWAVMYEADGTITMDKNHNPIKGVVLIKVEKGKFVYQTTIQP